MHNFPRVKPLKAQKYKACRVLYKGNSEITLPPSGCLPNEVKGTRHDNWNIRKEKKMVSLQVGKHTDQVTWVFHLIAKGLYTHRGELIQTQACP